MNPMVGSSVSKGVRGRPVPFTPAPHVPKPLPKGFKGTEDEWKAADAKSHQKRQSQAQEKHEAADLRARTVDPNTVRRVPWREHVDRNQVLNAVGSTAAAGGLGYLATRPRKERQKLSAVGKKDGDRGRQALGAGAGVAAVDAAYVVGGQSAKAALKHQRGKMGETPREQQIWAEHKQKHGLKPGEEPKGSTPAKVKHKIYTKYPKELPGWKAQRVLGWKNHNGVYGGALAAGAVGGALLARPKRDVAKGGLGFALVGGATGSGALGAAAGRKKRGDSEAAKEAIAGAAGGWGAQGLYQGAGYAAKHRAQRKYGYGSSGEKVRSQRTIPGKNGTTVQRTKSQENARLKAQEKKLGVKRGTVDFDRKYPKSLPEWRTHRILGYTHRGRTGTALGGAVTALGAYGAAEAASGKKKPFGKDPVSKAREYGYMERKRNHARSAQAVAGVGLLAYGLPRSKAVGSALRRGAKLLPENGKPVVEIVSETGRYAREVTAHGERFVRQNKTADRLFRATRPETQANASAVGGAYLVARAQPTHDERFTRTGRF